MNGVGSLGTMCCRRNSRQEKQDRSELAKDAALRKHIIPEGAPTGEEGPSADDPLSTLPKELMVGVLMPNLDSNSLARFSQTSKALSEDVQEADEFAGEQLPSLKEELDELITNSGITGIQNPVGPFKNSIHQLRFLTAFKDVLPNAISALNGNGITDINLRDQDGKTPLHEAASHGQAETVLALIVLGADVNLADNFRSTPLHRSAINGHTETVQALIDAKAVVNLPDNFGVTPLHEAARHGHTETVQALIDAKAVVNLADNDRSTPLHWAAIHGHTAAAQALINAGADLFLF